MKRIALLVLLIGTLSEAHTQTTVQLEQLIRSKCSPYYIRLEPRIRPGFPVYFDTIRVLDQRLDTTRLGITNIRNAPQEQLLFHTSASTAIGDCLNAVYAGKEGTRSLLVVVKNLWLSSYHDSLDFKRRA